MTDAAAPEEPLPELERVHVMLDTLGLPREFDGAPLAADARLMLMVGRYANHEVQMRAAIDSSVAANQQLAQAMRAARDLLVGAPHASDLRIRRAIKVLETGKPPAPAQ